MEFSALFLSCVFHMLWRVMLDFSPTAGKPVSHLLCESWSYRGNGGNTEEFFIRAFDQDIVDFFLWRNNKFPWKFPPNHRSSQRWISQQDKSSSLELQKRSDLGRNIPRSRLFSRWKTQIWVPSLSFDISFLIGEVPPGCRRTERFLIPYKYAIHYTWAVLSDEQMRNKVPGGGGTSPSYSMYLCIYQPGNDHISHQRGKIIIFKRVFFWGHVWSFPRSFFYFYFFQFQPVFFWCMQFPGCSKQVLFLRYLPGLQRDFWAGAWDKNPSAFLFFQREKSIYQRESWLSF